MNHKEINNFPMFFIVGRARSGTTLLQTLLDAHPEVTIPGESCFLMHLKNKYFTCNNWSNSTIQSFLSDILKEKKIKSFWNLNIEELTKQLYSIPLKERNFVLICKMVYLHYPSIFDKKEIHVIGDKNPIYSLFIPNILEIFPQAKFIHLVRDYRANVLSNKEVFSMKNISVLAHSWKYQNLNIELAKKKYSNQFLTIRYEDLVTNSEFELKKICDFLKITYDTSILHYHQLANKQLMNHENLQFNKIHGNLLNPVNDSKVSSWQKKLSKEDIELIEYIAGNKGLEYGYSKSLSINPTLTLLIKSMVGNARNRFITIVIKLYYFSPFFIKSFLSAFSDKMNQWFRFKNYYNQTDFSQ